MWHVTLNVRLNRPKRKIVLCLWQLCSLSVSTTENIETFICSLLILWIPSIIILSQTWPEADRTVLYTAKTVKPIMTDLGAGQRRWTGHFIGHLRVRKCEAANGTARIVITVFDRPTCSTCHRNALFLQRWWLFAVFAPHRAAVNGCKSDGALIIRGESLSGFHGRSSAHFVPIYYQHQPDSRNDICCHRLPLAGWSCCSSDAIKRQSPTPCSGRCCPCCVW